MKNRVGAERPAEKRTIISICLGYHLYPMRALALLHSQGATLNLALKKDFAYLYLLIKYRDKTIISHIHMLKVLPKLITDLPKPFRLEGFVREDCLNMVVFKDEKIIRRKT